MLLLQWTWKYKWPLKVLISVILSLYAEMRLLDHTEVLFLVFWRNFTPSSIVAVPIYMHTHSEQTFPFLHVFTNTHLLVFLIVVFLNSVRWYLIVLIWISLLTSEVEYFFTYVFVICVSTLENIYSGPSPIFFKLGYFFIIESYELFFIIWILTPYQVGGLQRFSFIP